MITHMGEKTKLDPPTSQTHKKIITHRLGLYIRKNFSPFCDTEDETHGFLYTYLAGT